VLDGLAPPVGTVVWYRLASLPGWNRWACLPPQGRACELAPQISACTAICVLPVQAIEDGQGLNHVATRSQRTKTRSTSKAAIAWALSSSISLFMLKPRVCARDLRRCAVSSDRRIVRVLTAVLPEIGRESEHANAARPVHRASDRARCAPPPPGHGPRWPARSDGCRLHRAGWGASRSTPAPNGRHAPAQPLLQRKNRPTALNTRQNALSINAN